MSESDEKEEIGLPGLSDRYTKRIDGTGTYSRRSLSLNNFPERNRIETLPSPDSNRICHNLGASMQTKKKNIFVDYVGSPITNESRKLNNRFFRSSLPLHRFVNSYYPLYHFDTCEQVSYYSSQNNSLPFFHSIPPNSRSLILERKRERRIQPEYFLFSCGLLS